MRIVSADGVLDPGSGGQIIDRVTAPDRARISDSDRVERNKGIGKRWWGRTEEESFEVGPGAISRLPLPTPENR